MAEEYADIPLEHLAGLGSGPAPRPSDRDLLDYYLGPTGIPDRVRSANQLLNPIAALEELGAQSAAAADPNLSPEDRRRAALAAALGTGLLAIPAARPLAKSLPAFRSIDDDAARAVVETLTGAAPAGRQPLPGETLIDETPPEPDFWEGYVEAEDPLFNPPPAFDELDFDPPPAFDELDFDPPVITSQQMIVDQGPFFSTVLRAVDALPQDRYGDTGEVLRALERNGARPDEIRALGLEELAFEGPITRDELSARVAENLIEGVGDLRIDDIPPGYRAYFPADMESPGLMSYHERVISLPRSAVPGSESYQSPHWDLYDGTEDLPIMHYRTGVFSGPNDERYFHLGEVQSDYVQAARHQSGPLAEFARQNPGLLGDVDSLPYDRRRSAVRYQLEQAGLLPEGASATEVDQLWGRWRSLEEQLLRDGNLDMAQLPVAGTTDKFTQLGLRSALADAIADEADYFTIAPGASVQSVTGGDVAGQLRYYDEIVPRNMAKVLKDLNRRSDVLIPTRLERVPAPSGVYADTEDEMVWGLRLTPEIRDAIRAAGMPVYRDGGLVGGSR